MSVCVAAILSHRWKSFSQEAVREIALVTTGVAGNIKYFPEPPLKSPEEEFKKYGYVLCWLGDLFGLRFGKQVLILQGRERWSRFRLNDECRKSFLKACRNLAILCNADEVLILPEGTIIENLIHDGAAFEDFKRAAAEHWGSPNVEIDRTCDEADLYRNNGKRVDYALASSALLNDSINL